MLLLNQTRPIFLIDRACFLIDQNKTLYKNYVWVKLANSRQREQFDSLNNSAKTISGFSKNRPFIFTILFLYPPYFLIQKLVIYIRNNGDNKVQNYQICKHCHNTLLHFP